MRVLITGASGFIGAHLTRRMAAAGHEVFAAYREGGRRAECGVPVLWNLGCGMRPRNLPDRIDSIAHLAQARNYRRFPADAAEMFRVNVAGTAELLEFAADTSVAALCLVSSGTVYEPYAGEISEDAFLKPTSYLGASKLAAEILSRPYDSLFRLSVLRLFFPYGPGQQTRLIPDLADRVRNGVPIQLASDGEGVRLVPTFVDDVVEVIATSLEEGWRGTYNVANATVVSLRQLAGAIAKSLGKDPVFEITTRPAPAIVPRLDRLRERIDLARFTPLDIGIERTFGRAAGPPPPIP